MDDVVEQFARDVGKVRLNLNVVAGGEVDRRASSHTNDVERRERVLLGRHSTRGFVVADRPALIGHAVGFELPEIAVVREEYFADLHHVCTRSLCVCVCVCVC